MRKVRTMLVVLAGALLLLLAFAFYSFSQSINSFTEESTISRLREITQASEVAFSAQTEARIRSIRSVADYVGKSGDLHSSEALSLLHSAVDNDYMLRGVIVLPDGSYISTDDQSGIGGYSSFTPFQLAMQGELTITDPQPSLLDSSQRVMMFTCPIYHEGQPVGALIYAYLSSDVEQIFSSSILEESGNMLVASEDGSVLINPHSDYLLGDNFLQGIRERCSHKGHTAQECARIDGDSGYFSATLGREATPLLVLYERMPYNDWYLFSIVSSELAMQPITSLYNNQRNLSLLIFACVLLYTAVVVGVYLRTRINVDRLTGALTLRRFKKLASRRIQRHPTQRFIVVKLDVRNFKLINRAYGFATGDLVIKNIAQALHMTIQRRGIFARIGIDDFIILLPFVTREGIAEQRDTFIRSFYQLMGQDFAVSIYFPTGQYVTSGSDVTCATFDDIYEKVNFAHRQAKQSTGDQIVDYEEAMEKNAMFRQQIEDLKEDALKNGEFSLYLQPKHRCDSERIGGAEALVRWRAHSNVFFYPNDFIPIFEESGFIEQIDMYIFERSVETIRTLMDEHLPPIVISVNFSRRHLNNENFVQQLCRICDKHDVPHKYLQVELTENIFLESIDEVIFLLRDLHAHSFTLAMDDFGSGYSSLGLLKDLEVDVLKIDRQFFLDCADRSRAETVITHIMQLAQALQIETVAEGVETRPQVDLLRSCGCDLIQGFYFARPMPVEDFLMRYRAAPQENARIHSSIS